MHTQSNVGSHLHISMRLFLFLMKSWCLEKLKSNEPNSGLGEIPVLQRLNIIWAVLRSLCPVWVTCTSLFAVPGNLPQRQMEYFWLCPWALVDLYWYNRTDWDGDVTHFGSSWWWAPFQESLKAKSALVPELQKFLGKLQVLLTHSDELFEGTLSCTAVLVLRQLIFPQHAVQVLDPIAWTPHCHFAFKPSRGPNTTQNTVPFLPS